MEIVIVIVTLIAFAGFRQWLKHQGRAMVHRERLAAIEKGVEIAPLQQELSRRSWNVQQILLLSGLIWISLGIGSFGVLTALLAHHHTTARWLELVGSAAMLPAAHERNRLSW